jgi:hypothetical protein
VGEAAPPDVGPIRAVALAAVDKLKLNAGAVFGLATVVVKSGLRFPELKVFTLPDPGELIVVELPVVVKEILRPAVMAPARSEPIRFLKYGVPLEEFGEA